MYVGKYTKLVSFSENYQLIIQTIIDETDFSENCALLEKEDKKLF